MDGTAEHGGEAAGAPAPPRWGRRRPLWLALAAVLVAAVVGGVVVANAGGDEADADEVLHDARTALAQARAYRFHLTTTDHLVQGEAGGAGSDTTIRGVTGGEVRGDDWHTRSDEGEGTATEATSIDGELYVRGLLGDAGGRGADTWAHLPATPVPAPGDLVEALVPPGDALDAMPDGLEETFLEPALVMTVGLSYLGEVVGPVGLGPAAGVPGDPAAVLGGFQHVEVAGRDGGVTTLRATKPAPAGLAEKVKQPVPDGRVELDVDADGRPRALRLTVAGRRATFDAVLRWSDWDAADITVARPAGAIDEDAVARIAAGLTPVAPTDLPAGFVLHSVDALTADEPGVGGGHGVLTSVGASGPSGADVPDPTGTPDESCDAIDLFYGPPVASPADVIALAGKQIDVTLTAAACARAQDPTPFAPGADGATPVRPGEEGGVEALVGDTVVAIAGDVDPPGTAALVGSLRPLDLQAVIAELGARERAGKGVFVGF